MTVNLWINKCWALESTSFYAFFKDESCYPYYREGREAALSVNYSVGNIVE